MTRLDHKAAPILIDLQQDILDPKLGRRNNPAAELHLAARLVRLALLARDRSPSRHCAAHFASERFGILAKAARCGYGRRAAAMFLRRV